MENEKNTAQNENKDVKKKKYTVVFHQQNSQQNSLKTRPAGSSAPARKPAAPAQKPAAPAVQAPAAKAAAPAAPKAPAPADDTPSPR